ncbi:MAG: tetratricopeptide repeat protein [Isosphaeraceae bacterium]
MTGLLDIAMAHHRSGRLDLAERGYRYCLAVQPDDSNALHLLGVALCQKGRKLEALEWINRAIERRPDIAAYHGALGEVLRELGRHHEAAAVLAKALELDPSLATAHNNLGLVHVRERRADSALACFEEAVRLRPAFTTARINRGEALQALGLWDQAAAAYLEVLQIEPNNAWVHTYLGHVLVELGNIDRLDEAALHCRRALELSPGLGAAHTNLGNVYKVMGRLDDALASYRRAIEVDSSLAMPWNNIGRVEQQLGRFEAARAAYEQALEREPGAARVHANLASLLSDQDRHALAVERYQLALRCEPDHAEAYHGMAVSLVFLGRRALAWTALETAIRLRPRLIAPRMTKCRMLAEDGDFERSNATAREVLAEFPKSAEARFYLAMNLRARLPDEDFRQMVELIDHPYHGHEAVVSLAFGIGTVHDARGCYEEAARFFEIANARQAALLAERGETVDSERISQTVEEIMVSFTPEFFQTVRGRGSPSRRPIFIVGMPRSGTTLTEQILASHPRVYGAGELDDINRVASQLAAPPGGPTDVAQRALELDAASFRELADRYVARLEELGGSAERVVDKMPSNYLHLGLIAALWPESQIILCRRDPRDIALSCWATYFGAIRWANDLRVVARQIIEHDRLIAHWKTVLPIRLIEVVYEELVADFEPQARRLVEAVGLEWDPACLEYHSLERTIRTASLGQVRQPIYSKSVGRWKNYEAALAPLFETFARYNHPVPGQVVRQQNEATESTDKSAQRRDR